MLGNRITGLKAIIAMLLYACVCPGAGLAQARDLWNEEQANTWFDHQPWRAGANYIPRDAINQLEMWQADTFDPLMIEQEFGWAERLGFSVMRVFLHNIPWQQDQTGFLQRIEQYLSIADRHHIRTIFVFFDSCWDPLPYPGKQRSPRLHVHNSGWVQSPGRTILSDPRRYDELEGYVSGIITHFRTDQRVLMWDLFNEMDNGSERDYDKKACALALGAKAKAWALAADPIQPITFCIWQNQTAAFADLSPAERFEISNSDIISFHAYTGLVKTEEIVTQLRTYHRPFICTEYMARTLGSTFAAVLPYYKKERISAINWGFVDGKTQTKFPWDSWDKIYSAEPPQWFHDVLHSDGTAYDPQEEVLIRSLIRPKD